jgi:hypothetical protein
LVKSLTVHINNYLPRENLEQEEEAFFQPFLQVASHQLQANYLERKQNYHSWQVPARKGYLI